MSEQECIATLEFSAILAEIPKGLVAVCQSLDEYLSGREPGYLKRGFRAESGRGGHIALEVEGWSRKAIEELLAVMGKLVVENIGDLPIMEKVSGRIVVRSGAPPFIQITQERVNVLDSQLPTD